MEGLLSTFDDMRAPNHPWRAELRSAVEQLIFNLANATTSRQKSFWMHPGDRMRYRKI
jgi:hypothetical protein